MPEKIRSHIEKSLESFMDKIKKDYKLHLVHPGLYESIREFNLRKGKRLRPLLLIISYKGYSSSNKRTSASLYNAATCIFTCCTCFFVIVKFHRRVLSSLRRACTAASVHTRTDPYAFKWNSDAS